MGDKVEPIAIVGMSCRFPGDATSPKALWKMATDGESAWSPFPKDRVNIASYHHPSGNRQGSICFQGAHFLKQNPAAFDISYFSISAEEAKSMDPQQRMLLEVASEAMDSAGIDRNALRGSETGVWVGSFVKDYEQIVLRDPDNSPMYGATGNGIAIMSNRISYFLDVNGPSMTIDTGCSASLVCVHNACQSLRDGEIDVGLAGGAGLILTPNTMMPMTALNFLSPDGKCFTFDARANGYGRGEGIGIVVLKRLTDAIRDNDTIRAVIRGSRVNQDGRTAGKFHLPLQRSMDSLTLSLGITLPSAEAQIRNIRAVYKRAGLEPDQTAYVECHGTGTQAGDSREVGAVSASFCERRNADNPIYVGSIKANIGHLEGCAGIAGLIKGILTIENGIIPKHINFEEPGNPAIDFKGLKVKVPTDNTPWPVAGLRRASVNCFGFGGTNAHVILDDAAHYLAERGLSSNHNTVILNNDIRDPSSSYSVMAEILSNIKARMDDIKQRAGDRHLPHANVKSHLFIFSAHEERALSLMLEKHAEYLVANKATASSCFLEDLAYTLGCRRTNLQWKTSVAAQSIDELISKLKQVDKANFIRTSEDKITTTAFIFGGQGAQWFAMGRELLGFDIYLESIVAASTYMSDKLDSPFNLLAELLKDEGSTQINKPQISQPATTALQVALVDVLVNYYGVTPSSVVGHSSGEIAAAYAMGAISREAAWEIAYHRGLWAATVQPIDGQAHTKGRMLAVGLSKHEASSYVDRVGSDRVMIACINSPASVTLSGDSDAIMQVHEMLNADSVFSRLLAVDIAYHSHHMRRCALQYLQAIEHLMPREPVRSKVRHPNTTGKFVDRSHVALDEDKLESIPKADIPLMYSSVTGKQIGWEQLTPSYWMLNMTSTVLFSDAITEMLHRPDRKTPDIILELGPHATLQGPTQQILNEMLSKRTKPTYLSMLHRKEDATITALETTGKLWTHGCNVDMAWVIMRNLQRRRPALLVDMPKYPWNHTKSYWHESHLSKANRFQTHGRYDLVGRPTADSMPFQRRWRGFFRVGENPWIEQHQVQKTTIYPAAGMVSMVIEGARQLSDSITGIELSQFKIEKAMLIPSTEHGLEYALNLNKHDDDKRTTAQRPGYSKGEATATTSYDFFIFSKPLDGDWQQHGSGTVTIHHKDASVDGVLNDQASKERVLEVRRYQDAYIETKDVCDEVVIPRQLYETLDVIGMNYGPLFRNITSLCKRDNHCHYVVRIPDTKSIMPAQFEFPHIIHPATLDSVFQTAFSFGGDSMVPSFIGSLYVSFNPGLPSGADKELVGYAKAEERRCREARVSFVMSDESWKDSSSKSMNDPLIIVKDMTFTTLTTSPDIDEGGFLPNHHNLCSEIVWEDERGGLESDTSLIVQPHCVIEQHVAKLSGSVFLLVPHSMSPDLAQLCDQISSKLQCGSRTLDSIGDGKDIPAYCLSLLEVLCGHHFVWNWSEEEFSAFRVLVNSTKGVFWVTRGAQLESTDPKAGLFGALARTIQSENPQKHLVTLDIAYDANLTDGSAAERIVNLFSETFSESAQPGLRETEYADRAGKLMVPRLLPIQALNKLVERGSIPPQPVLKLMNELEGCSLQLEIGEIGKPKSLYWDEDATANLPLASDEVKIKVMSAGLSTLDTDVILGHGRDHAIGTDVYGMIESIGDNIQGLSPGDRVIGIVRGSFKEHVRCLGAVVQKVPDDITDPSLVLLPTSIAVAHYALYTIANLRKSDTILIHAGAGSFGQAAVRMATDLGAKVFITATNCDQRRMLVDCYRIPDGHILDGSSTSLVESIMHLTNNVGVRVAFDPTGEYRESSQDCVAEAGHIIEFAKKYATSGRLVDSAGKTFTLSVLDLVHLIKKEPMKLGEALRLTFSDNFTNWMIRPSGSVKRYDYSELPDAVSALAEDENCSMAYIVPSETTPVPILSHRNYPVRDHLQSDGTYVLAGQGGLSMHIAKILEANGVKNIALLSRSGASSEASRTTVTFLQNRGVNVQVLQVDICDKPALQLVVETIQRTMPRIRGLFQCAATIRDAVFDNMTYDDWQAAVRPKTAGSWNLYELFPRDMDYFIFLSSSAGVIGNRGQANYAVGNAFQDALARHINNQGSMRSVSIDLGPVLGAGMLAEDPHTLDILKASGFFGVRLQDFERVVERAITGYTDGYERVPPQVVIGVGTGGLIRQNKPADPYWTRTALFTHLNKVDMPSDSEGLLASTDSAEQSVKSLLAQAQDAEEARDIVTTGMCHLLAASMNMKADDVDHGKSPSAYGVDSLVAVGVRNWVFRECSVDVSMFQVLSDTSISELSADIVEKGGFGAEKP